MQAELSAIISEVKSASASMCARAEFEAFKATIQGPKGRLTAVMKMMGQIPKEEKPAMGQLINQAKNAVQAEFDQVLARIEKAELAAKLGSNIDPSLPSPDATAVLAIRSRRFEMKWCNYFKESAFLSRRPPSWKRNIFVLMRSICLPTILHVICRILTICLRI